MANIQNEIEQITSAIYGRQVRSALANGLTAVNNQVNNIQNNVGTLTQEAQNALNKANNTENIYNQTNTKIEQLINQFNTDRENLINEINKKEDNLTSEIYNEKEKLINSYNQTNSKVQSLIQLLNNTKEQFFNTSNHGVSDINEEFTEGQYAYSPSTNNLPSWASYGMALVFVSNGHSGIWNQESNWMWQILFDTSGTIGFRTGINNNGLSDWEVLSNESYVNNQIDNLIKSESGVKGYLEVDGVILQWGEFSCELSCVSTAAKDICFPITFPRGVVYANANIIEKNNEPSQQLYNISINSIPTSNSSMMICVNYQFQKRRTTKCEFTGLWFAIGY